MERPILAALLSLSGPELKDDEKHLLSEANPIGISLFKRNISSPQRLQQLIADIKETIGRDDVIIAIDQEGGRVRRHRGRLPGLLCRPQRSLVRRARQDVLFGRALPSAQACGRGSGLSQGRGQRRFRPLEQIFRDEQHARSAFAVLEQRPRA